MAEINKQLFPSNSIGRRVEGQKETRDIKPPVTTAVVVPKKTNFFQDLGRTLFDEDANSVGTYILKEIVLPTIKNTIAEIVSGGIEMLLFGETRRGSRREKHRTDYGNFYTTPSRRDREDNSRSIRARTRTRFDDIVIESASEANEVLSQLNEMIDTYSVVSVADFYDLVGVTGEFTDNDYGWSNLSSAVVRRVRDGYILDLPRPTSLS